MATVTGSCRAEPVFPVPAHPPSSSTQLIAAARTPAFRSPTVHLIRPTDNNLAMMRRIRWERNRSGIAAASGWYRQLGKGCVSAMSFTELLTISSGSIYVRKDRTNGGGARREEWPVSP
ncbi:hypothetical protein GCM10010317_053320 [Streptomyces mirabilis]|nr:hypothetical protein GCM10010317_053320 [Streptomyces mirabilis]